MFIASAERLTHMLYWYDYVSLIHLLRYIWNQICTQKNQGNQTNHRNCKMKIYLRRSSKNSSRQAGPIKSDNGNRIEDKIYKDMQWNGPDNRHKPFEQKLKMYYHSLDEKCMK